MAIKTRIQQKADTLANWRLATGFIPLKNELLLVTDKKGLLCGDGVTSAAVLAGADGGEIQWFTAGSSFRVGGEGSAALGENSFAHGKSSKTFMGTTTYIGDGSNYTDMGTGLPYTDATYFIIGGDYFYEKGDVLEMRMSSQVYAGTVLDRQPDGPDDQVVIIDVPYESSMDSSADIYLVREVTASGEASWAGGTGAQAKGANSLAYGDHVKANLDNQVVFGKYNINRANALFIIGNGESQVSKKNAFEVTCGSDGVVALRVGNVVITETQLAQVLELISNLSTSYDEASNTVTIE